MKEFTVNGNSINLKVKDFIKGVNVTCDVTIPEFMAGKRLFSCKTNKGEMQYVLSYEDIRMIKFILSGNVKRIAS